MNIINKNFVISGSDVLSASVSASTDSIELSRSYEPGFQWIKTGTDGDPIITIEVSTDDVNFNNPYLSADGVTPLTFTVDTASKVAFDSILPFKYVRMSIDPNGTTTGTLTATVGLTIDA